MEILTLAQLVALSSAIVFTVLSWPARTRLINDIRQVRQCYENALRELQKERAKSREQKRDYDSLVERYRILLITHNQGAHINKNALAQLAQTQSELNAEKSHNDDLKKHRRQLFNRILELRRERDLFARELDKHKPMQGKDGRFIKKS